MSGLLIKPYEISVWEDRLTQIAGSNPVEYKFEEKKLAIIGSNTMDSPNKVYEPVFNKKSNGEKSLTFSLKYKYFDPYSGNEEVINPFAPLLINERKVKLKYDDQWYEFIIKEHTESSDGLIWTYTCTDAFVLELSKSGYDLTFDSELNNNQGTARELTTKVLEGTEWRLGDATVDKQKINEPIYKATLVSKSGITIINASGDEEAVPAAGTSIYVFYNYVANKNGKFVQFIIRHDNEPYIVDDNNTIVATNFRITTDLTYDETNKVFKKDGIEIIRLGEIETQFQAYRLAYNIVTTYDPVMKRTVEKYKYKGQEVYSYKDNSYVTSTVITNYFTNGDNFNAFEDGSIQGWSPYTRASQYPTPLALATRPVLSSYDNLVSLESISAVEGFLKVNFPGTFRINGTVYENTIYNSGFSDNVDSIGSISAGQEFVLRYRAGSGTNIQHLSNAWDLRAIVAGYTEELSSQGHYLKRIDPNNIILWFNDNDNSHRQQLNNIIKTGNIVEGNKYVVDGVVQTPSSKYIYQDKDTNIKYLWSLWSKTYVQQTDSNTLPYYYWTATARKSVSNKVLTDPSTKIGLFVYAIGRNDLSPSLNNPYYINDIQLFPLVRDGNGDIVTIGNAPEATTTTRTYYYEKPASEMEDSEVDLYTTLEALRAAKEWSSVPTPVYNEDSEKILSISESQSNCFSILQTISETFECWVELSVDHDNNGFIILDDDGPRKFVYLKQYAGKNNYSGFKYGINLDTIERTVNSDEIVTKLIVDQTQNDCVPEGYISIQNAPSNPSRESYILNFDYYLKQGLIPNTAECKEDLNNFYVAVKKINDELSTLQKQREQLEAAIIELGSRRNVYAELINAAKKNLNEALDDFKSATGITYSSYISNHSSLEKKYTDEDTILEILGRIYSCASVANNYGGLLSQAENEYKVKRNTLNGKETFKVTVSAIKDSHNRRHVVIQVSDYLVGTQFQFGTYTNSQFVPSSDDILEVTVSEKDFDIETDATYFKLTPPTNYTVKGGVTTFKINDTEVNTYRIISTQDIATVGIKNEIEEKLKEKENYVNQFNNKYSRFIQEGTWNSSDYIDSELYYLDALQVSHTSAHPEVSYSINVVEISQLEGFEWYLFDVGDKTYIEDTEFFGWANKNGVLTPAREEVIVAEVEWHLDEPDQNTITIQNYKTQFEDFFQRVGATVQTVQYNEATYAKISSLINPDGTINQDVLITSINRLSGQQYNLTSDGSVRVEGDAIIIRDLTNPSNSIRLNSLGLSISSDGGTNWRTIIDGQGIDIGAVRTGKLNTDLVIIGSEDNPSFRWDKSGISAYEVDQTTGATSLDTYVRYDQYGLYGIKDNTSFKAQSVDDVIDKAHFAVTWDGFFIKNSYEGGGRVEITSDNDFRVLNDPLNQGNFQEKIKIGALEWGEGITSPDAQGATELPTLYGIRIKNNAGDTVMQTGDDGNLEITGTIYANAGEIGGMSVDDDKMTMRYIVFEPEDGIYSTYPNLPDQVVNNAISARPFWISDTDGSAIFNNVTVRGSIKTSVFEYEEIQAVGGAFLFRPSSSIRSVERDGNDLIFTVEKLGLFNEGSWLKISNYSSQTEEDTVEPDELNGFGLTYIYPIPVGGISGRRIRLTGAAAIIDDNVATLDGLCGGSLIDMGNQAGTSNYGIGINSSDGFINLPPRAISLFETVVHPNLDPKISYRYRGILGTLPDERENNLSVNTNIYSNMRGTQGIYTDNMYIGDLNQYIAFYEDGNGNKQLRIKAKQIMFELSNPEPGQDPYQDIADIEAGKDGENAINVQIESNLGNFILSTDTTITLTCTVYSGSQDITNQVTNFTWTKNNQDGTIDANWIPTLASMDGRSILVDASDIQAKAIFICTVEF